MPFGFGKGTKSAADHPDARKTAIQGGTPPRIDEKNQTPSATATADLMGELAREEGRRRADSDRSSGSSIPSKGSPQGSPKGSPRGEGGNDGGSPVREDELPKLSFKERLAATRAKSEHVRQLGKEVTDLKLQILNRQRQIDALNERPYKDHFQKAEEKRRADPATLGV